MTNAPLDLYCERTSPAFWAEPVNALTNLSFILAAIALWHLARQQPRRPGADGTFLIANVAAIGLGSFLFHTYADRWTMLADVLPIFVYQLVFLACYARRVVGLGAAVTAALVGLFVLLALGFARLPGAWLNGSLAYGAAFVSLAAIGVWHHRRAERERATVLLAFALFLVSVSFRSLDLSLCADGALGTHFLWHLLNGAVLYLTTRAYLLNRRAPPTASPRA
ncbi:ceramidase domain-containing protein [Azoarcus olearius]|nr:ceramidase domain-containing protein [Azoarcus olearius]